MYPNIIFYAVCITSYRDGINHGRWIDAMLPVEEMRMEIDYMLSNSIAKPHSGARIIRFDTPLPFKFLDDETSLEKLHDMANFILEHGEKGACLLEYFYGDVLEARDTLAERDLGYFESTSQFIFTQLHASCPVLPDWVADNLNYQALEKDWLAKYYLTLPAKSGGLYVFQRYNGIGMPAKI